MTLNGSGTLELNNALVLNSATTPLSQVRGYITQARNGGTWDGVGGLTSSAVQADTQHKGMAYFSGANPANAGLVGTIPALTNTAAIFIRPALLGDFNGDGIVDRFDIRQFNTRAVYNDGGTNHDWADGDLTGDGVVDRFDIRAFNTAANYNNGVTFAAHPATLTAKASAATAAPSASTTTPTTIGTVGDGKPDLIYDPSTGDVHFSYDGYVPAGPSANFPSGNPIVEIDIGSAKGSLRFNNRNTAVAGVGGDGQRRRLREHQPGGDR